MRLPLSRRGISCACLLAALTIAAGDRSARGDVVVDFMSNGGFVYHGARKVNSDSLPAAWEDPPNEPQWGVATNWDALPVIPQPFMSPDGMGGRYGTAPPFSNGWGAWYGELDGSGTFEFQQQGTLNNVPVGSGTFGEVGMFPNSLAAFATLSAVLALPNGLVLNPGTMLFADFAGLAIDFDNPAHWWYDSMTNEFHYTYSGGTWTVYYEQAGDLIALASYEDVSIATTAGFVVETTWSGTPVATNGLLLPASGTSSTNPITPISGIINEEVTPPTAGFYSLVSQNFSFTFDTENATTSVPEPASLLTMSLFALACAAGARRRISVGGTRATL